MRLGLLLARDRRSRDGWVTRFDFGACHTFSIMFACGLLAGRRRPGIILGPKHPGIFTNATETLAINTATFSSSLLPLPWPLAAVGLIQPGWGLDAAMVVGALSLFGGRPLGAKVFFAASLGLAICYVRVPLVSNFLDGYFPAELTAMCGIPLGLRIMPVIVSFAAMAGVLWFATLPPAGRWTPMASGILAVLVGWSGWEATRFVRIGHVLTSSQEQTETILMPENVALARYAYDLMHLTQYYSNGVVDPRLETRLLDGSGNIIVGPEQEELALEAGHRAGSPENMKPSRNPRGLTLSRISRWGLVSTCSLFEFDPHSTYNGFMLITAEHACTGATTRGLGHGQGVRSRRL